MPREITAFSNPLVKRVRSLRDKKHRKAEGLFLAEGLRILTEAREAGRLPDYLFFAADSAKHPLVTALVEAVDHLALHLVELLDAVIDQRPHRDDRKARVELDRRHRVAGRGAEKGLLEIRMGDRFRRADETRPELHAGGTHLQVTEHRLAAAGSLRPIFDDQAVAAIFELSHGVPRRINRLADLALLVGFAEELRTISRGQIEAIYEELTCPAAAA